MGRKAHKAFPISCAFQIYLLSVGTWLFKRCGVSTLSTDNFTRPAWSTGTPTPLSLFYGIAAVVLIWKGGQRTKETKELYKKFRAALNCPPAVGDETPDGQQGQR